MLVEYLSRYRRRVGAVVCPYRYPLLAVHQKLRSGIGHLHLGV